jgi:hypothetical protein
MAGVSKEEEISLDSLDDEEVVRTLRVLNSQSPLRSKRVSKTTKVKPEAFGPLTSVDTWWSLLNEEIIADSEPEESVWASTRNHG